MRQTPDQRRTTQKKMNHSHVGFKIWSLDHTTLGVAVYRWCWAKYDKTNGPLQNLPCYHVSSNLASVSRKSGSNSNMWISSNSIHINQVLQPHSVEAKLSSRCDIGHLAPRSWDASKPIFLFSHLLHPIYTTLTLATRTIRPTQEE